MTAPLSAQRVEELRVIVKDYVIPTRAKADLLVILDSNSSMRAENEQLKKAILELGSQAAENLSRAGIHGPRGDCHIPHGGERRIQKDHRK